METQATHKPISTGICAFCKTELAKNKMTQHLKSCKERRATIAKQEEKAEAKKTRIFHILAEGQYNPQYWLHFEVPAYEDLWTVDNFLKDMWIDDTDHLSGFTINGTKYRDEVPDYFYAFNELESTKVENVEVTEEEEEEKELSEEEIIQELKELIDTTLTKLTEEYTEYYGISLYEDADTAQLFEELKKPRLVDELIDFLKEARVRVDKERAAWRKQSMELPHAESSKRYHLWQVKKFLVDELLDLIEDRSLEVELGRVLKVGQKFSYIYDYGSSTYINLRVLGERDGVVLDEKDPVRLLARNAAPKFACKVCGERATMVVLGYYGESIADSVYCTKCVRKHVEEGQWLPITNSPRTGVL